MLIDVMHITALACSCGCRAEPGDPTRHLAPVFITFGWVHMGGAVGKQ